MAQLDPQHLRRTFTSVAGLFDEAHAKGVTIDSAAVPTLMDTVEYYTSSPESNLYAGQLPREAIDDWHQLVAAHQGQMIAASSIWPWIRKFFPDPISLGIIRFPIDTDLK